MEATNGTESHQVVKDGNERELLGNPPSGGSAELRRDCTNSTDVGSTPPTNNDNNCDVPTVNTPTTEIPNDDPTHNHIVSLSDTAMSDSLIFDSLKEPVIEKGTGLDEQTIPNTFSTDKSSSTSDRGNDETTLYQSCKPLTEKIIQLTDEISNPPPKASQDEISNQPPISLLDDSNRPPASSPEVEATTVPPEFAVAKDQLETDAPNFATEGTTSQTTLPQQASDTSPESSSKERAQTVDPQEMKPAPVGPAPVDETTIIEDAIRALRAPLEEAYAPYIEPCDTSLEAARARLRTAIEQTRQLRAAFSERVYEKYRVCLRPPPSTSDILNNIYADPVAASARLQEETRNLNDEREVEKKEAHELNSQWASSNAGNGSVTASNAENAEQLMYISAGLSLVILPEQDVDDIDMSRYHDRAPIDSETGHRIRSISVAAAAAGELIIDRARKGAALIAERKRKRQSLQPGEVSEGQSRPALSQFFSSGNAAAPVAPVSTVVPTKPALKPCPAKVNPVIAPPPTGAAPVAAKSNRSRAPPSMSANNLLSLSPMSEELKPSAKLSAATAALISRGVPCSASLKSPQQRLKHPHPDSPGGRRQSQSLKNYASYLSISLPPIPTSKERRDSKLLTVADSSLAGSLRAISALQRVLGQFASDEDTQLEKSRSDFESKRNFNTKESNDTVAYEAFGRRRFPRKRRLTEIGLLQGVQGIGQVSSFASASASDKPTAHSSDNQANAEKPIDPILALCVLQAVGLVRKPCGNSDLSSRLENAQLFLCDSGGGCSNNSYLVRKLRAVSEKITAKKRKLSDALLSSADLSDGQRILEPEPDICPGSPRSISDKVEISLNDVPVNAECEPSPSAKSVESCPVASLRGGGDVLLNSPGDGSAKDELHTVLSEKPANERQGSVPEQGQDACAGEPTIMASDGSSLSGLPAPLDAISLQMPSTSPGAPFAGQNVVWDEHPPQGISMLNSHLSIADDVYSSVAANSTVLSTQRSGGIMGPQTAHEHYHHRPTPSALQLAQQLRHATVSIAGLAPQGRHSGAAELSEYIGSLHSTQARGYDWSSFGAAAMAASMGLPPNLPDQARLLLSREHQTAVAQAQVVAAHRHAVAVRNATSVPIPPHLLFNGVPTHSFSAPAASRFAHLGAQSAASAAAFLNSSAPPRLVGRADIPTPPLAPSRPENTPGEPLPNQTTTPNRSRKTSGQPEGFERVEDKANGELLSKDKKKQIQKPESSHLRKRKALDESVDLPSEPLDKRKKIAGPDVKPGESTSSGFHLQVETTEVVCSEPPDAEVADAPLPVQAQLVSDNIPRPLAEADAPPGESNQLLERKPTPSASIEINAMRFVLPPVPPSLPLGVAELVRYGRFHDAIELVAGDNEESLLSLRTELIEYLMSLGANVPIPKALVSNPLKDRLSTPLFRNSSTNGNIPIPREVIVATILVWLWNQHEDSFQRAFAMNGRIDVDQCCKWLIQAAIDASMRALATELADAVARGGPMASALAGQTKTSASSADDERASASTARLDVLIASTVNKSLMAELEIDDTMDMAAQVFQEVVGYLDECRLCALRSKSRERALLAALVSRKTTMSESFSHAYVSAAVRAGLALGHVDLCESVRNGSTMTSTMVPYDIIEDESGLWEDPCRRPEIVTQHLSGDDLMKRAHARAMIQKSLKKLQDRHHLKGGVQRSGPYADPVSADASTPHGGANKWGSGIGPAQHNQRGWSKRRTSSFSEPPIPPGTGSAEATSKSLYDPRHYSAPLIWLVDEVENSPYGRHNVGIRPPSIAPAQNFFRGADAKRVPKDKSCPTVSIAQSDAESGLRQSTCEIQWADVAGIFQQVTLPGSSPASTSKREAEDTPKAPERDPKSIIAPFCRKLEGFPASDSEDVSSDEENLSDEEILKRHQVVLDRMKQRLNTFFETRKKAQQQRRKNNKIRT